MASLLFLIGCTSCHKEEQISPLAGTSWECVEAPEILVLNDNNSGLFYCKSATDDVFDSIYSSFDFVYTITGKNITLRIYFSKYDNVYDFVMEDDDTLTCGKFHYKKIQHK